MTDTESTGAKPPRSEYAADLLMLALLLVPCGLFGMFVEMIGLRLRCLC
jgi:hypothetical protein